MVYSKEWYTDIAGNYILIGLCVLWGGWFGLTRMSHTRRNVKIFCDNFFHCLYMNYDSVIHKIKPHEKNVIVSVVNCILISFYLQSEPNFFVVDLSQTFLTPRLAFSFTAFIL